MTFASRSARLLWGIFAVLIGLVGYTLASPAFRATPPPPNPWALYVTTNGVSKHWRKDPANWLLNLSVSAKNGCGHPVTVFGTLNTDFLDKLVHQPSAVLLSIANAQVLNAQIAAFPLHPTRPGWESARWRPMTISRFRGVYIVEGLTRTPSVFFNNDSIYFRLTINASRSAGYSACYLTSPGLVEYPGASQTWDKAAQLAEIYQERRHFTRTFEYAPLNDAIVRMAVPGELPDRTALDAHAVVRSDSLQLTCSAEVPDDPHLLESDYFSYERILATESNCASVQTYREPGAADDLNRRLFLAGVLLSAAVAMLIEAVATGRTEQV